MRGFLIGLILGTGLIACAIFVPRLLEPGEAVSAVEAREEAEIARRHLANWDPGVDLLKDRAGLDQLKEADLASLTADEQVAADLEQMRDRFSTQVSAARNADRKADLAESSLRAVDATPSGLSGAISAFEAFAAENAATWDAARKAAQGAASKGGSVFGVPIIAGMTDLAEGRRLLARALHTRTQMRTAQTNAVTAATRLAAARAELRHYAGLDPSEALETLERDRATLESELAEVRGEADRLRETVSSRESEIEQLVSQITQTRNEMLRLQEAGFQAGSDGSFSSYRSQYESLAKRMLDLQAREHLLHWGGFEQGDLDWTAVLIQDADTAVEFDGPVLGLEELRRRLALLDDKLQRYESGIGALNEQADMARAIGESAERQARDYGSIVQREQENLNTALGRMATLSDEAIDYEDRAIQSAESALTYFQRSASAASAMSSTARKAQSDFDPQRLNQRLNKEIGDRIPEQMASTAQAEAETLIGRIYAERVGGLLTYQRTLELVRGFGAEAQVEMNFDEMLAEARQAGSEKLSSAIETYTSLGESSGTGWIFDAARGSAEYARGLLNPSEAATYRANAQAALQSAVEKAGKSPYATRYALFLEELQTP